MLFSALPRRLISAARLGGLSLGLLLAQQAGAQTLVYQNFSSTSGLNVNGDAEVVTTGDGSVLRLAPAVGNQAGTVFTTSTLNVTGFSTVFEFRITDRDGISDGSRNGADGLTFIVQNEGNTLVGGAGASLGYEGISPSVAVEFDTFFNSGLDPAIGSGGSNHVGINKDGSATSIATAPVATNLDDGAKWTAWIDYNGTTLEVRLSPDGLRPGSALLSHTIDIATLAGGSTAFIGFSAGTGGAHTNHDLLNWAYSPSYVVGGITAVPEPGTYALLGLGGLLLIGARRFRRAR
jgi:Legume lectin domain/PEP-CTERM motif